MSMPGGFGDYEMSPYGGPLSKETKTTYGGAKPGKAPTLKQPTPPDPYKLIDEQAKVNNPDINTPLGTSSFRKDPVTGAWVQNREYSPELKNLFSQRLGMVSDDLQTPNLPSSSDFSADADKLEQSTFARQKSLLDPIFEKDQNALTSKLANQGIMSGSEAYTHEFDDFNRRKSEAYNKASLDAVGAGRAEQGRLFGEAMQGGQLGFQQDLGRRSQLYNELASLIGTQQIGGPKEMDVTGPFSQQYQGQVSGINATNAANASRNAGTTSAAATGTAALIAALMNSGYGAAALAI